METSNLRINLLATKIWSLLFPIKQSLQLINAFAVAANLATSLLKGFAIHGVGAQATSTVSKKPSTLGKKAKVKQ